jgi:putative ABC transport system substrate-binding protein
MMERRTMIGSLALVALAGRRAARAQPVRKVYRIGILSLGSTISEMTGPQPKNLYVKALLDGLRALGYVYGEHLVTEPRGAEGRPERFPGLVAELLRLGVEVIVAVPASAAALKQATSTIPIVLTGASDPVAAGVAQSLAHPGWNFTGLSNQDQDLIAKRLELLKQLAAPAAPIGVVWDRANPLVWQVAETAARERGWKLLSLEIRDAGELEGALNAATAARAGAVLLQSGLLFRDVGRITALATNSRLPAMYAFRFYVEQGGLMSYAVDLVDVWRRTAVFVDKILKGAKAGDLPIEQPTKFELVINLKTAKALGLTIPPSLLARADQVLE